jgi:hypothetical protein
MVKCIELQEISFNTAVFSSQLNGNICKNAGNGLKNVYIFFKSAVQRGPLPPLPPENLFDTAKTP